MHIRLSFSVVVTLFLFHAVTAIGALPVFPGAEGFGTETPAGRGGRIIKVTNLNASGSGSLDAALRASGPRIVVFEVGGTIDWSSKGQTVIRNGNLTVAGQTAPAPGITIKGAGLVIAASDVLVQHIRIRTGDLPGGTDYGNRDSLSIDAYNGPVRNVVIDHCSISWGIDENFSLAFSGVRGVTVSNSIISEGLLSSKHPQGLHSMGLIVGDNIKDVSIVKNLFAHNDQRNPLMKGGTRTAIVNNVIYNPGYAGINYDDYERIGTAIESAVVGNVSIAGADTSSRARNLVYIRSTVASNARIYLDDNRASGSVLLNEASGSVIASSSPVSMSGYTRIPSSQAEDLVLGHAGARPLDRDSVDERVVSSVRNRTGRIIASQSSVGGWPSTGNKTRTLDLPSNPDGDSDGDGYTNIEEYLFAMAQALEKDQPQPQLPPTAPENLHIVW